MPEEEHRKLKQSAHKAGLTGERKATYVYGTLHKIKTRRKKKYG